jgi:4-aminobutyrate aminotransferase-like enzyme
MGARLRKHTHDSTRELKREDRRYLGRPGDAGELEIVSAAGSRVTDARGRTFIDFQMGWCVGNLGWNHPVVVERLRRFAGPSYVSPSQLYAPWIELAKQLAAMTPGGLERCWRAVGGTEAVELALQLAMAYTGRTKLVSIEGAYHGNSFGAVSVGEPDRLETTLQGCKKLAPPLDARALDRLETLLAHRDVAAFLMEPVIMNLGVEIPAHEFMRGAAELCKRHGTLFIADEVACGFGRTGALFACEHYGLEPDIMTLGKAITGGHAPLAAVITTAEISDAIRGDFEFYSTFGWHPLAVEAARATLDIYARERAALLANVAERSHQLVSGLSAMPWPGASARPVELRVKGLAIAVRVGEQAARIAKRCRAGGLLLGDEEDLLMMFPALTVDAATVDAALEIIEGALAPARHGARA